jgi:NAD(P)H-flavin reductase
MLPELYAVERNIRETKDTITLELRVPDGVRPTHGAAMRFGPGQFNMLYAYGVGEAPISISGDPEHEETLVHTIRAVGSVTNALCALKRGEMLGVRGPYGSAWPVSEAVGKDVVIVAGGIGLAPLRPAIYHLLSHRELYGRVSILYGARTPQDMLYPRELERWRARFDLEVEITVDNAERDWRGHVGVVTKIIPKADLNPANALAMLCGPEIMMRYTVMALEERDLTHEQIYVSMERNMKCGIGLCGHCQWGPLFVCKDGPVFRYSDIAGLFGKREV